MGRLQRLLRQVPGARRVSAAIDARVPRHVWRDWVFSHFGGAARPVRTPLGFVLHSPRFSANRQMQDGLFEPAELACVQRLLLETDRFVDVGANIGWYTCVARAAGRKAVAIEPQRQNLDCLYRTLVANDWSDTEVVAMGAGREPGLRTLYGASGPGASLIRGWAGYSPSTHQIIPMTTLDVLLHGRFAGERLLIKIDVEGAEHEVLEGAAATLDRTPRPAWMLEICLEQYHPGGNPHFLETFERFWSRGYTAHRLDASLSLVSREDVARWVESGRTGSSDINYLFRHSE